MPNKGRLVHRKSGFLLFELMVSLTVLAIAISGVLFCFNQSMKSFSLVDDYERARIILHNQLNALYLEDRLVPGESRIALEEENAKFYLDQIIKPTAQDSLYQVSLVLRWGKGSGYEEWRLETLFLATNQFKGT